MTWKDTVQDHMDRDENNGDEDTTMNEPQERTITQRSKNGTDEIRVDDLVGETVSETCKVCRRSLLNDGDRSELFHITALPRGNGGVQTTSFCEHCRPPHAIDVDVMVKSGGTTPRSAYVYYEIENVFLHESEMNTHD